MKNLNSRSLSLDCAGASTVSEQPARRRLARAFTLIELLVVIAIIGVLAALIVGLTAPAGVGKVRNRLTVEKDALVGAIENYHKKYGFYPPDNRDPKKTGLTSLYYELTGIDLPDQFKNVVGVDGTANVISKEHEGKETQGKNFLPNLKKSGYGPDPDNGDVVLLLVPYGAPPRGVNPWHYRSSNPDHNTESFDLWADVTVGRQRFIIGNWKD